MEGIRRRLEWREVQINAAFTAKSSFHPSLGWVPAGCPSETEQPGLNDRSPTFDKSRITTATAEVPDNRRRRSGAPSAGKLRKRRMSFWA